MMLAIRRKGIVWTIIQIAFCKVVYSKNLEHDRIQNNFPRKKSLRVRRHMIEASEEVNSLFQHLHSTREIQNVSACTLAKCVSKGTSFAFVFENLDNGAIECANGVTFKNYAWISVGGEPHKLDIRCSNCYPNGYSRRKGWPKMGKDNYIIRFWIIDKCIEAEEYSRCHACDKYCLDTYKIDNSSSAGPSRTSSTRPSDMKNEEISNNTKDWGVETSKGSNNGYSQYPEHELCCAATGACNSSIPTAVPASTAQPTANPTSNTETSPPSKSKGTQSPTITKTKTMQPSSSPTASAAPSSSPLPCPVTCKDILSGELDQAAYYLQNNPNPTLEDYEAASCEPAFDLRPCCFPWCNSDGSKRNDDQFPKGCPKPPKLLDCAPSAAPSPSSRTALPTTVAMTAPPTSSPMTALPTTVAMTAPPTSSRIIFS